MLSRRLDILLETLKSSAPDKHFFEIVTTMTADDWSHVVLNQEAFRPLLPYMIYAYNAEVFDEVELTVGDKLGQALADAWFTVFHGGSRDDEGQPSIEELGSQPSLVPILTGHLLKKLERAGYNAEFGDFIREKHSKIISELVTFATNSTDKQVARVVFGAAGGSGIFPPLSDYDTDSLQGLLGYAFLLNSIQYATFLVGLEEIKKLASLDDASIALKERRIETLMDSAGFSETRKRRHLRELKDVEGFIQKHLPDYLQYFSSYTLMENERVYLTSLFESGLVSSPSSSCANSQENDLLDQVQTADLSGIPKIDLGVEFSGLEKSPSESGTITNTQETEQDEGNPARGYFEKFKDKVSSMKPDGNDDDSEESLEDMLVKNGSKKKSYLFSPIVLGVIALGFLSWFFVLQGENNDTKSFIEQKAAQEQEKALLPAVKVYTK